MDEPHLNPDAKVGKKNVTRWFFNLIGLFAVIVIVVGLFPRVWTNFNQISRKSRTIEAWKELRHTYTLQQKYQEKHGAFASNTDDLGYTAITPNKQRRYEISIQSATNNAFVAVARAKGPDVIRQGCKQHDQWEINQEKEIKAVVDCTATDGRPPLAP